MAGRVHKAAHCPSAPTLSSGRYTVGAAVVWCGEGFDGQNILLGSLEMNTSENSGRETGGCNIDS